MRSNAKGRQTKSKARLARYEEMAAEADRTRKLDFEEIADPAGPAPRLARSSRSRTSPRASATACSSTDLSFTLPRNGIVGVIGPNGVGKTTLFKTIVGLEEPDGGDVKVGETVKISYVDQSRAGLDPKKNLWETVSDGLDYIQVGNVEIPSRAYVSQFGFKGPDQQKMTGVLSGGERNRLNLALTLKQGGNLLLLDEPTNDLDVETLGSLENALLEFPGCAVVISHDRWFLDRVATHILAYEGTEENPAQLVLVRGQLRVLRGEQGRAPRRRRGPAAPGDLPQAHPRLTCRRGPTCSVGIAARGPATPGGQPAGTPHGRWVAAVAAREGSAQARTVATARTGAPSPCSIRSGSRLTSTARPGVLGGQQGSERGEVLGDDGMGPAQHLVARQPGRLVGWGDVDAEGVDAHRPHPEVDDAPGQPGGEEGVLQVRRRAPVPRPARHHEQHGAGTEPVGHRVERRGRQLLARVAGRVRPAARPGPRTAPAAGRRGPAARRRRGTARRRACPDCEPEVQPEHVDPLPGDGQRGAIATCGSPG